MIAEHNDTKTEFEFHELSPSAKERAIGTITDRCNYDWADPSLEEWGIKLQSEGFRDVQICYSGFHSQGDGASFTASFYISGENAEKLLLESELAAFKALQVRVKLDTGEVPPLAISGKVCQTGYYSNESSMCVTGDFQIGGWDYAFLDCYTDAEITLSDRAFENLLERAKSLSRDIYSDLEKEYEYQTSEQNVAEMSKANDWRYDKEGNLL